MKRFIFALFLLIFLHGCATTGTGSKEPINVEVGGTYQVRGVTHIK
ncbi:MAG TPA: hypothetical protein PLI09_09825 [Candidatus Hydrogenedentes bacterium]|nr:hypothetical protein [Candidatus Hydrogenedentota bacterium]